jgi:hypothetical protein
LESADAGFKVIAFSRKGRRAALRHNHRAALFEIAAPEENCDAALRELAAMLDAHHVLLPLDDASLWLCSRMEPA